MEVTDFASRLEAIHNETSLKAHLAQREVLSGPSAVSCTGVDCDMPIPERRRVALPGVQLCAECQMHREKRGRQ